MIEFLRERLRQSRWYGVKRAAFLCRGILFAGGRYRCPCCGWRIRSFVGKSALISRSPTGYCPRCNAKARHRRLCLYLAQQTDWLSRPVRLLEVGPWWAVSRRLQAAPGLEFVGVDLQPAGPHVNVVGDLTDLPFTNDSFDAAICTHVLEHVTDDRASMAELCRVLRPGGAAIVSAPLRLDRPTDEDPSITDPEERKHRFGERGHVRWYGTDLPDRLRAAGFEVAMDAAADVPESTNLRYGLRPDENLFLCEKPAGAGLANGN